jgi:hypothetical protein
MPVRQREEVQALLRGLEVRDCREVAICAAEFSRSPEGRRIVFRLTAPSRLLVLGPVLVLALAATARAQDAPGRSYVDATAGVTAQPAATPNHRIRPPLSGAGFPALAAAGGFFIRPSIAVEGEVATAEVSIRQGFYYSWSQEYTASVRATTIGGGVRWKPRGVSPVELVVGVGRARVVHGTRDGIEYREYPYPQGSQTPMPDSSSGAWVWSVKGGADVVFPRASRAAFVAGTRVRWRQRIGDDYGDDDYRGVSPLAFDFGAGVRVRF